MERDQPIATATIADIYLQQGLFDEAEALYNRLLADAPGDRTLTEGLARVRQARGGKEQQQGSGDTVQLRQANDGRIGCRWKVAPDSRDGAQELLGDRRGQLTLRLATFPRDEGKGQRDVAIADLSGELLFKAPRRALVLAAAVGLLSRGRFVSVAHGAPLSLSTDG